MLQVILVCHQSVPISGSCWGSVLGALGEVCRSLLSWGGVASAPWCKSQLQGTSLGVGRKEQLVLLGGSKALLWRCFDPGTEWGERERRSREGRWGHPSWEGSSSSLFSWSSIYPSRAGGASRKLCMNKNGLVSFLGIALVFSAFLCALLGTLKRSK